jgi:hypothetical protein
MRIEAAALALVAALAAGGARAEEPALRVVLRWQSIPGAEAYDLQIAADPAFARIELSLRVPVPGHRLGPPPAERQYWRVRSVDSTGRPGPWSLTKAIEPAAPEGPAREAPAANAATAPTVRALDVPPPAPRELTDPALAETGPEAPPLPSRLPENGDSAAPPLLGDEGSPTVGEVLHDVRPGASLGWRSNLLGVSTPEVAVEAGWPLPWLGDRWGAVLRAGWWREQATIPAAATLGAPVRATADVLPIAALVSLSVPTEWARLYGAAGAGAHLVVVRLRSEGALEATAALVLAAGGGRRLGRGEAFVEVGASLGGVDGPLGRLRTGGLSVALGYRGAP